MKEKNTSGQNPEPPQDSSLELITNESEKGPIMEEARKTPSFAAKAPFRADGDEPEKNESF